MTNARHLEKIALGLFLIHYAACSGGGLSHPDPQATATTKGPDSPETPTTPTTPTLTGTESRVSVISDVSNPMTIVLDANTVLCSFADYSASFLKVLIPQIASVTVFDHTNSGAGQPCIAAGECSDTLYPEMLIDASKPDEDIALRVVRTRTLAIDHDAKTCTATLVEELHTTIRGVTFYHQRSGALPGTPPTYADCVAM